MFVFREREIFRERERERVTDMLARIEWEDDFPGYHHRSILYAKQNAIGGFLPKREEKEEQPHLGTIRLRMQLQNLPLERLHPPEGGPDEDAAPVRIGQRLRRVAQPRVLEREPRRRHREVGEAIVALGILGIGEVILGHEHLVGHLAPDLARVIRYVESRDRTQRRHAVRYVREEILVAYPASAYHAEAGHDHTLLLGVQLRGRGGGAGGAGGQRRRRRRLRRECADGGNADDYQARGGEFHFILLWWCVILLFVDFVFCGFVLWTARARAGGSGDKCGPGGGFTKTLLLLML